ncbi:MAG: hypothetical protein HQ543_08130 [Bacteroidetes bacterium]|nr:hypothetical protein [Bacteroidota bacterium]
MTNKETNEILIILTIVIALGTLAKVLISAVTTEWKLSSLPTAIIVVVIAMLMGILIYAAIEKYGKLK